MKHLWTDDQYRLFVFDAYGTLFHVGTHPLGISEEEAGIAGKVQALWRQKVLEYTWLRSLMARWASFDEVVEDALDYAMAAFNQENPVLRQLFLDVYTTPEMFDDVIPFLDQMKEKGREGAILSNGSQETLESAIRSTRTTPYFKALVSSDAVEVYKPSPLMYRLVQQTQSVQAEEVVYFSANPWDVAGARSAGFTTVWVNRAGQAMDPLGYPADFEISSLQDMMD